MGIINNPVLDGEKEQTHTTSQNLLLLKSLLLNYIYLPASVKQSTIQASGVETIGGYVYKNVRLDCLTYKGTSSIWDMMLRLWED